MNTSIRRTTITATWVAIVVMCTASCAEDVAAPTGLGEPYSLFGIINPRLEQQTLLVAPITGLLSDFPDSIDAVVRTTDLQTGEVVPWRDSVVVGERGQVDHVYVADFRPPFKRAFRVEAERSDGAMSSVEVRVPGRISITHEDHTFSSVMVTVTGESFRLLDANVLYTVRWINADIEKHPCRNPQSVYRLSYADEIVGSGAVYRFRIDLGRDYNRLLEMYLNDFQSVDIFRYQPGLRDLVLLTMRLDLMIADPSWDPPNGVFDPEVLSEPGLFSNVTNGYGFVSGGYNQEGIVFPGTDALDAAPFIADFYLRPPFEGDNVCMNYCLCACPECAP